jgi:hypothetical protein
MRRLCRTDARKAWGDGSPRSLLPMHPAPAQKAQRSALAPRDADGREIFQEIRGPLDNETTNPDTSSWVDDGDLKGDAGQQSA